METQKTKTTLGSPGGRAQGRRKGKEVGNGGLHQVTPGFGPSLAQRAEPPGRAESRPQECRRAHLGAGGRGSCPAAAARLLRGQPLWHFRGRRGFASVLLNNMVVTRASVGFSDRRKSEVWLCRLLRALGASLGLRFLGHQGERLTHASKGHTGSPRGRACSLEQLLGCPERSPRTERLRGSIQLTVFQALKVFAICLGRQAIKSLEKRHQYFPIIKLQGVWFQV